MATTLKEIARRADVSLMTASRAIRGTGRISTEMRSRIRKIAAELGYRRVNSVLIPSAVIRGTADQRLRMLMPVFGMTKIAEQGYTSSRFLDGLRRRLAESGGSLQIEHFDHPDQVEEAWDKLRVKGMVLRQPLPRAWVQQLSKLGPTIYATSHDCQTGIDCVYHNEHRSAATVLDYLSAHGHEEIAWFGLVDHHDPNSVVANFDGSTTVDRQAGATHGLRHAAWANLAYCQTDRRKMPLLLLDRDHRFQTLDQVVADGLGSILALRPQPTAVVVASDVMGLSLCNVMRERRMSVPEDLSVISYGGSDEAKNADPPLTTLELPMAEIGRVIPELIERRLANPQAPAVSMQFETRLWPGRSVARLA